MLNSRQSSWIIGFAALIVFTTSTDSADQWRTVIGLAVALVTTISAYGLRTLSLDAIAPATCIGTITVGFGGWDWGALVVVYFMSSSVLGFINEDASRGYTRMNDRRSAGQVWANGLVIALLLIGYQLTGLSAFEIGAAAGLATATADTWATEIGMKLNRKPPRLITTWEVTASGSNGGITLIGTLAGALGSLIVAALVTLLANYPKIEILSVVFGTGMLGMILDSLLGATWERKLPTPPARILGQYALTNNQVNGLSIAGSAIVAILILT